jgi:hypothetical protein
VLIGEADPVGEVQVVGGHVCRVARLGQRREGGAVFGVVGGDALVIVAVGLGQEAAVGRVEVALDVDEQQRKSLGDVQIPEIAPRSRLGRTLGRKDHVFQSGVVRAEALVQRVGPADVPLDVGAKRVAGQRRHQVLTWKRLAELQVLIAERQVAEPQLVRQQGLGRNDLAERSVGRVELAVERVDVVVIPPGQPRRELLMRGARSPEVEVEGNQQDVRNRLHALQPIGDPLPNARIVRIDVGDGLEEPQVGHAEAVDVPGDREVVAVAIVEPLAVERHVVGQIRRYNLPVLEVQFRRRRCADHQQERVDHRYRPERQHEVNRPVHDPCRRGASFGWTE